MEPFVVSNFQAAIADSPHTGFADMRNLDVSSEPGVAKLNLQLQRVTTAATAARTFTANAAGDFIDTSATLDADIGTTIGRPVLFTTTGTLPDGLSLNTVYFLSERVNSTRYKVATTLAAADLGQFVDILDAGSGTHTVTPIDMGLVKAYAINPATGVKFVQDTNGRVWFDSNGNYRLLLGNTLTNASGNGLNMYKNYLFVFRDARIDVCDVSITAKLTDPVGQTAWSNDWATFSQGLSSLVHPSLEGQDQILYIGDGRFIASVSENTGQTFAPGSSGTYTFSDEALDLPLRYRITALAAFGTDLLIGASRPNTKESIICPWDRRSESYRLPVPVPEPTITAMKNILNQIYVAGGTRGIIYTTNGIAVEPFVQVPEHLSQIPGSANQNVITITDMEYHKERVFFTVSGKFVAGVWSVLNGRPLLEHRISSQSYGTSSGVTMGILFSEGGDLLHTSWQDQDASTYGIDSTYRSATNFIRYTSYAAYLQSAMQSVGSNFQPRMFEQLTIELDTALATGQGVRVSYRTSLADSFTTMLTFDHTTYGAVKSINYQYALDAEELQLQVEVTTVSESFTTPRLKSVILQ